MAKHIARGVEVNHDTLAVDVIDSVGQEGNFLTETHTLDHFKKEFYEKHNLNTPSLDGDEKLSFKEQRG